MQSFTKLHKTKILSMIKQKTDQMLNVRHLAAKHSKKSLGGGSKKAGKVSHAKRNSWRNMLQLIGLTGSRSVK